LGVVAEIFLLEDAKVFDRIFQKAHVTSASNRMWSTFVPSYRWRLNRNAVTFSKTRCFLYSCNYFKSCQNCIPVHCLCCYKPTKWSHCCAV